MSDDVKDFTYYAAKAELALRSSKSTSLEGAKLDIGRAEVYARLACGASKAPAKQPVSCDEAHPQYGTYHPEGH